MRHIARPDATCPEFVGQHKLPVTAGTYLQVLLDETEVDYVALLSVSPVRSR